MREKKKKMYLLAMAILLINTTSFGANYNSYNGQESKDPNKYGNEKEQTKEVNPVKTKDVGIMLTSGDNKSLKVTNKVDIVVDGGTGVKTNIYKDKDGDPEKNPLGNGKNLFINEGNITINGGIGVDLYAPDKIKGENRFENNGTLTVNSGTGVKLGSINGSVINNKDIIVKGGVGVSLLKNGVSFTNNNNLTVSNGTGIQFDKTGTVGAIFVNSGNVIATNGIAVNNIGSGNATTYLKNGSTTLGVIQGNVKDGVDILALEGGDKSYKNLDVKNYNAITVRDGEAKIEDSKIELSYNKKTEGYLNSTKNELDKIDGDKGLGNLTISNSSLTVDMNGDTNKLIDAGKLTFDKNISLKFQGSEKDIYNVNEILGIDKIEVNNGTNFEKTVIWSYDNKDGNLVARKKDYFEILNKSQLKDFTDAFQNTTISNKGLYNQAGDALESIKTEGEFNKALTQLSGGLHGYTVDIAAVNSRTLSNTIKNRALTRDYLVSRPVSSWIQDVTYIDNNHKFGGLMDVDYREKGAFGISEKQILKNGRLGIVYGGSTGKADAGEYGDIDVDAAYFGGYYHHTFNDNWSLNSNANFVYTHNRVTRNLNFGEGKDKVDHQFKSNYPTYTLGIGSKLIYTLKDDNYNRAYFYTGLDVNAIMQGMITEDEDKPYDPTEVEPGATELAVRKKTSANDKSYYSIVPNAGFMVQNSGYIFDKKYRIGADFAWETELGHIKDGKRIDMKGISREYKVETTERENIFSYSILGELNLTEDLAVNARYTSMFSDEYDADLVSAGFEYKMDTMGKNLIAPLFYGLENNKPASDRWGGTFGLMLENEDATDRTYWDPNGNLVGGDYATSNEYKPKFTLSLNDKKTAWSYYFEGYYKSNDLFGTRKGNEEESHASRIHGEARWTDTYSKGKYGINIGYRNETSNKPRFSDKKYARRAQRGVHQLRLTPNFTYELGNGFTFTGKTTGVFEYNYTGERNGQMDFLMENEYGIIYTGFNNWRMSLSYFRDDRWYDNSNEKITKYNAKDEPVIDPYKASRRYQLGQLRPTVIYYFGNGGSFKFDVRIPLGNGQWYNDQKGIKGSETYEVRYGVNYYHPVTPGITLNIGGTLLDIKSKAKTGDITRSYSFRPNIGISYSF
ncbi:MAG: autotransporter domain-containing protein [Fusobacterium sp.]|uniref:autotransporter domain-containing protein n=1 Tax=Fusobacterium sp. TaxID=68766 RepID=UPI0039940A01